jgi:hypothetical protein
LACAATLGGCANCVDQKILKPAVERTPTFDAFYNSASQDEVVLKSDAFSLWLHPCVGPHTRVEGTVCATLGVPAGNTVQFSTDAASLQHQGRVGTVAVRLRSNDFKFSDPLTGDETPARNNFLVYEAYKMAGRKWTFEIQSTADFNDFELGLSRLLVNGHSVEVPKVRFSAEVVQRCYTFH